VQKHRSAIDKNSDVWWGKMMNAGIEIIIHHHW